MYRVLCYHLKRMGESWRNLLSSPCQTRGSDPHPTLLWIDRIFLSRDEVEIALTGRAQLLHSFEVTDVCTGYHFVFDQP